MGASQVPVLIFLRLLTLFNHTTERSLVIITVI